MYKAPSLPVPQVVTVFPEKAIDLWLKALDQPEADVKCQAAEAIALAHRRGMKGLEKTIEPLVATLDQPDQRPAVRLGVARTLIALDARTAAPSLLKQAQANGGDLRELIEPALARWDYLPARAVWLENLRDPATTPRSLVLAIQSLAVVQERKAVDRLKEITLADRTAEVIRLEAARALGVLRSEGLEEDAKRLLGDGAAPGVTARLAAASLLRQHQSAGAIRVLQRLADDAEPAVAAPALARLLEINPDLVLPRLEHHLFSADSTIRSLAVEVLFRLPTETHLRLLADRLDDVHVEVRIKARRQLLELAEKKELRDTVIAETTRMLATQQWRALEQATILLTLLDHKPAAKRLVELLPSDRPEVAVTAAWGLRKLAVPETLPGVLSHVEAKQKSLRAAAGHPDSKTVVIDHQLSQLNQFLGQQKYEPGEALLQEFIPRMAKPMASDVGAESRAAAIWALGIIHEGNPDAALAAALEQRLNDTGSMPPEFDQVRFMAAISLGRRQAKEALPSLRNFCPEFEPSVYPVSNACGWAIAQLTGKTMPPPKTIRKLASDWFLKPLD
jgi:HEAT repeat protein